MITLDKKIVLGSSSPRRKELLRLIVKDFTIKTSNNAENYQSFKPDEIVQEISHNKSKSINILPNELLITADTIVTLDDKILGKPKNEKEAFLMLKALSNRTHYVYTGITLRTVDKIKIFFEVSKVTFYELDEEIINYYIKNYNPFDKAGAYAIQDFAAVFVKEIEGDYYNIMGLPVAKLYWQLRNWR